MKKSKRIPERIITVLYSVYYKKTSNKEERKMLRNVRDEFLYGCLFELAGTNPQFVEKYIHAAGASKHHHNHEYGLLEHSFELAMELAIIAVQRKRDLTAAEIARVGFAHDLCKAETYFFNADGSIGCDGELYSTHAKLSLAIAQKLGMNLSKKEEAMILMHMSRWSNENDWKIAAVDIDIIKATFAYTRECADTQDADMAACKQYKECLKILGIKEA